ncbi:MAG: lipoyl(octanoyl) transferase LipB [Pseudomonadota bacterium]
MRDAVRRADWQTERTPVDYDRAVSFMEDKVRKIRELDEPDFVWLLEHPPLYTAGTSAKAEDMLDPAFPVYQTGRGGQYTYHGPGQRIAYVMMNLKPRGGDVRRYVHDLEEWVITALKTFDVKGERRPGRVGVWVAAKGSEAKIAAVGVRVRRWVTYHGVSINLDPDLSHYDGIVPCGIKGYGVTSLKALSVGASMQELDKALFKSWDSIFGEKT